MTFTVPKVKQKKDPNTISIPGPGIISLDLTGMVPHGGIVAFYENKAVDSHGRRLHEILRWPATDLEYCHDYIQILFPLPEKSAFNDPAPTIDKEVFEAFRTRKDLRNRLRDSFEKILWFYGYQIHKDGNGRLEVRPGPTFPKYARNWMTSFNHNHLRMTRIIRSLRVLGLEEEALAFYAVISQAHMVSARSRTYWTRAASRPLNIAPHVDDTDVEMEKCRGPEFLWDFEQERKSTIENAKEGNGAASPADSR